MSTPLKASLMVRAWTSVMVVRRMCLVIVLTTLGCTNPRVARSANSVTSPSCGDGSSISAALSAVAICCHLLLLWKAARDDLAGCHAGILKALPDCAIGTRRALQASVAVEEVLDSVTGHLRNAANMVKVVV